MSGYQRRAASTTADLELLAVHGFAVTITWDRSHQWTVAIKRSQRAPIDGGAEAVEFHAHADHLGEAVSSCMQHVRLA